MNKDFTKHNQALALKELGFDESCLATYHKGLHTIIPIYAKYTNQDVIKAPLYQQAFRWFRDVHKLEGVPQKADSFSWFKFCIWKYTSNGKHRVNDAFDFEHKTYEEAESACLDKLIEIIKNK